MFSSKIMDWTVLAGIVQLPSELLDETGWDDGAPTDIK